VTRNRLEVGAWFVAGLAAGVGLWFASVVVLVLFGFSFAAVMYGVVLELSMWVVAVVVVCSRRRRWRSRIARYRLAPLMAGILIASAGLLGGQMLEHPHWLAAIA
jgi:hypothetical protein